jgi:DNA-binding transcriptional MerR regulator
MSADLPSIPPKRYFTIGEVSELCGVKPHVLRYWEQEFTQLRPVKRRGNRRYYQHHEVLLIRKIRELLYDRGFTISGARNQLGEVSAKPAAQANGTASVNVNVLLGAQAAQSAVTAVQSRTADSPSSKSSTSTAVRKPGLQNTSDLKNELRHIRDTLLY